MLPGIARPGFVAGLAGARNRIESPGLLACARIVGGEEPANTEFTTGHTYNDFVLDYERRVDHGVARLGPGDGDVPDGLAGFCIDREQMAVDGAHEERVAEDCKTAINAPAADACFGRRRIFVNPEDAARDGVDSHHVVWRLDRVKDAIHHERRGFEFLQRMGLEDPLQLQIFHIGRGNLIERAITLAHQGTRISKPVLRFLIGLENAVESNLTPDVGNHQEQEQPLSFHGICAPFSSTPLRETR